MAKQDTLPTVRGDRAGYVLGGRSIDGFEDRPDLEPRARLILARMAQLYAPKTLSMTQLDLLKKTEPETPQPSAQLSALTQNLEDLDAAYQAGLFDDLSIDEIALIRDPSNHPNLPDARYPLTIGQTAEISGASKVQLRRWAEARLIPSRRIRGRLHFLGAGVLRAMLLAKAEMYEVSALMRILRGEEGGERLVRLLGITLASISTEVDERSEAGGELALASATLVRRSETIRKAAEAYSARTGESPHPITA
ncbi:MAG TPA: hypothetical protein VIJ66_09295 [Solirubrobacteraceae bacterium]